MKKSLFSVFRVLIALLLILCIYSLVTYFGDYGFSRSVSQQEAEARTQFVESACRWVGTQEGSQEHLSILEIYNGHAPLARDYIMKPEDNWCAAFVSACAIDQYLTDIIPTECGCQRQIDLWKNLGRWEEDDFYLPLPGDLIYYAWDEDFSFDDCTAWADHVGIVIGTSGPFIRVVEGNWSDSVAVRTILRGDWQIRGYAIPEF